MSDYNKYRIMTDAELIDEVADIEQPIVAELVRRVSGLHIQNGYIDDTDYFNQNFGCCDDCDDKDSEIEKLLNVLQYGDLSEINELLHSYHLGKREEIA